MDLFLPFWLDRSGLDSFFPPFFRRRPPPPFSTLQILTLFFFIRGSGMTFLAFCGDLRFFPFPKISLHRDPIGLCPHSNPLRGRSPLCRGTSVSARHGSTADFLIFGKKGGFYYYPQPGPG